MSRRSPYLIELTPGERSELERRARRQTATRREVFRAQVVVLAADGLRNDEIAERLGTVRTTVSRWRKRFFEDRDGGLADRPRSGRPRTFSPRVVVEIKALACERPADLGLPLARLSVSEIARVAVARDIVEAISVTTVWRWLGEDALKPWRYRSWIFPRDPDFERTAGLVLDLYRGRWQGEPLRPDEHVLCADEKTSIQARARIHAGSPPTRGRAGRVEHEYERAGALQYLAAWDVHRAQVFGRCEPRTGIAPFGRLVEDVMSEEPYASARRVFWVVDNGSSHRGLRTEARLRDRWPQIRVVHTPIHASWLNQVEIYFSIVQRKVLEPNQWRSLAEIEAALTAFGQQYSAIAKPFEWRFTRRDLHHVLAALPALAQAA